MPTKWVAKARVRRALSALIRNEGSALPQRLWSARTFDGGREKAPAAICREVIAAKLSGKHAFNQISGSSNVTIRPIYHERNKGKGGGLRTGFAAVTGDVLVIQDADVEYDPSDWEQIYDLVAVRKVADVVFGSRFYGRPHRSLYFHHYLANRAISFLFNLVFNQTLTDIETCYKMMTSSDFGLDGISGHCHRVGNARRSEHLDAKAKGSSAAA